MKQYKDMNQLERWFRWQLYSIGTWLNKHGIDVWSAEHSKLQLQITKTGMWFHKRGISAYDTIDWTD